jgi:hypothetical protein
MGAFRVGITERTAGSIDNVGVKRIFGGVGQLHLRFPGDLAPSLLTLGRQLPNILVALLTPAAMVAFVMGLWRVSMDLDWAGAFPIASGFFSHWQVWIALAIGLKMLSSSLLAWERRTHKIPEENRPAF